MSGKKTGGGSSSCGNAGRGTSRSRSGRGAASGKVRGTPFRSMSPEIPASQPRPDATQCGGTSAEEKEFKAEPVVKQEPGIRRYMCLAQRTSLPPVDLDSDIEMNLSPAAAEPNYVMSLMSAERPKPSRRASPPQHGSSDTFTAPTPSRSMPDPSPSVAVPAVSRNSSPDDTSRIDQADAAAGGEPKKVLTALDNKIRAAPQDLKDHCLFPGAVWCLQKF